MQAYFVLLHIIQQTFHKRFVQEHINIDISDSDFTKWSYASWLNFIKDVARIKNNKTTNSALIYFL